MATMRIDHGNRVGAIGLGRGCRALFQLGNASMSLSISHTVSAGAWMSISVLMVFISSISLLISFKSCGGWPG
jgi:hypothetical protein